MVWRVLIRTTRYSKGEYCGDGTRRETPPHLSMPFNTHTHSNGRERGAHIYLGNTAGMAGKIEREKKPERKTKDRVVQKKKEEEKNVDTAQPNSGGGGGGWVAS